MENLIPECSTNTKYEGVQGKSISSLDYLIRVENKSLQSNCPFCASVMKCTIMKSDLQTSTVFMALNTKI